jgi:hypothetical protein
MIKRTITSLALVLSVACASSPFTSSNESAGGGVAATSLKNAPDYILLSAPTQVRTYDFANAIGVRGLHVRGTMTSVGFVPVGDIQGAGKTCDGGRDWLSLRDLTVSTASSGKTPAAPYILGCATSSGFQPASRTIVMQ